MGFQQKTFWNYLRNKSFRSGPCSLFCRINGMKPLRDKKLRCRTDPAIITISEGLETPIQIIYISLLLVILATFFGLFSRELLVRRELDESAKKLSEALNSDGASAGEYFELGAILIRKELYSQALRNLQKSIRMW